MSRRDTDVIVWLLTFIGIAIVVMGGLTLVADSLEKSRPTLASQISMIASNTTLSEFDLPYTTEQIEQGLRLYQMNCASCHGLNDGNVQVNLIGKPLVNNTFIQEHDDVAIVEMIINGRGVDDPMNTSGITMPAKGGNPNLTEEDIHNIVAYLRTLENGLDVQVIDDGEALPENDEYRWEKVVGDFDNAIFVTAANDNTERLFVMEQTGYVLVVENGEYLPEPFLDISHLLPLSVYHGSYTEQGLLGLAFHPRYAENGYFFVSYTAQDGSSVIARYQVSATNPNLADSNSAEIILTHPQPFPDHNGGNLAFGPDGYLYMGFGDGGRPAEPNYYAQQPNTLLGKLIRIDVDSDTPYTIPPDNPFIDVPDFRPEIWAIGLRNPWRFSFDRVTGDLWIADVGQWRIEEINYQPVGVGGQNYGWSVYEGTEPYLEDATLTILPHTPPILEYTHDEGCSVTGGYVYRGQALPELHGQYFYGDYCSGRIWLATRQPDGVWTSQLFMETGFVISSFGEDYNGELLLVDYKGGIYRLIRK